jgi:hypothetical protein
MKIAAVAAAVPALLNLWRFFPHHHSGQQDPTQFSLTSRWCRVCVREAVRNWRYRKLGTSREEYLAILSGQLGSCAICSKQEGAVMGGHRGLHLDHDHLTGKRRGILCSNCNQILGRVKDSIAHLERMIAYLRNHGA